MGDFKTFTIGKESFIVVRGNDDRIRAFFNVCSHRGNRLVSSEDGALPNGVTCPFHGWEFALDGQNTKVTDRETFRPEALCRDLNLSEVRCESWEGFVFINMDTNATPLIEHLGPLPAHAAPYRLRDMRIVHRVQAVWDANWKLGMDGFHETYHVHAIHPQILPLFNDYEAQIDLYPRGMARAITKFANRSPRLTGSDSDGLNTSLREALTEVGLDPSDFEGRASDVREAIQKTKRKRALQLGLDYSANTPPRSAKEVFAHAQELSSPAERMAYLDQACADSPELRQQVEALLQALEEAGSFLETPAVQPEPTRISQPDGNTSDHEPGVQPRTVHAPSCPDFQPHGDGSAEIIGTRIGPYQLVEKLGEGGMGAVYRAEQERPIRRQVVLKIIKPGMDSVHVIARFAVERQALTLMEHVHIARVFDAGTTEKRLPYFVMELVKGVPISRFCDENQLTLRERLQLFETVCQAIQHAHQKGIIHRDIKSSNVLVAMQEGKPLAKVIDFGLAKATEPTVTDPSQQLTHFRRHRGHAGVHEPRTGRPQLRGCGYAHRRLFARRHALRIADRHHASRPCRAARGEFDRCVAENQGRGSAKTQRLRRRLGPTAGQDCRGAKDRAGSAGEGFARRTRLDRTEVAGEGPQPAHETASGFAKDVRRYLDDEPVEACPPSTWYRLGKFARKNRTLVGFVASLVAGVVALTWGLIEVSYARQRESTEREKAVAAEKGMRSALHMADAVNRVLTRNPGNLGENEKTTLRNVLRQNRQLPITPGASREARETAAESRFRVASIFALLGESVDAEASFRGAIDMYEKLANDFEDEAVFRSERARCNFDLARVLYEQGKRPEAEAAYGQAIQLLEKIIADFPKETAFRSELADVYNNLGALLRDSQEYAKAEKAFHQSILLGEQAAVAAPDRIPYRIHLAAAYHNLGNLVRDQGDARSALARYGKAIELLAKIDPLTGQAKVFLRNAYWDRANARGQLGQHAAAVDDWQRAFALEDTIDRKSLDFFLNAGAWK